MLTNFKKVILFAVAMTFAFAGNVSGSSLVINTGTTATLPAGSTATDVETTIDFGNMGTIDIDGAAKTSTKTEYVRLDDNRATNAGWRVSVKATDFINTSTIIDPTNPTGTVAITIPVHELLKIKGKTLTAISVELTAGTTINTSLQPITSTGVTVLDAAKGSGAGTYIADFDMTLTLPNHFTTNATITPSDATASTLDEKTKTTLGLFAGTYATTVTYSVVTAP